MSSWNWHKGGAFTEIPKDAHSFIYMIEINDLFYIGKKIFYTTKKKWFGKKKLAEITDKRMKKYEYIKKESNWKTYCSSSAKIKDLVEQGYEPVRTVLKVCYSAKQATYEENKYLYDCFEDECNINDNISGKVFKEEVMKWKHMI